MIRATQILARILARMAETGTSRSAVARLGGLTADALRNFERAVADKRDDAGMTIHTLTGIAAALDVSAHWLLTGEHPQPRPAPARLRMLGYVGAGAVIDPINNPADLLFPDEIELPSESEAEALIIRGTSQIPRFVEGEILLVSRRFYLPEDLIDQYAMVQTLDGRVLVKIIRRCNKPGYWRLDSHNSRPEYAALLGARAYLGTLSTRRVPITTAIGRERD